MDRLDTSRPPDRLDTEPASRQRDELLERYLAGAVSPSERLLVERMLDTSPEAAAFVARLRDGVRDEKRSAQAVGSTSRVRELLAARIGFAPQPLTLDTAQPSPQAIPVQTDDRVTRTPLSPRFGPSSQPGLFALPKMRWAVGTALAFGVLVLFFAWNIHVRTHTTHATPPMLAYATGNGERANITLPDGSLVSLNVASRLDVPVGYNANNRTVHLRGEALFTVVHHNGAPFTVVAGHTTARVLGTSFVVRHYTADTMTTVAVHDGKVAIHSTVLTAEQQADVSQTGVVQVYSADPTNFSFTTGVLVLHGMSLPSAIPELDRWYDADIRLGDPQLASHRIKGNFVAGSLTDLTAILELTFDVRVVRDGRVLTLYPTK